MKIILNNTGRRFNKEWIFKNVNLELSNNEKIVVLGSNGSGKSTLLHVLSGMMMPSEGELNYFLNDKKIAQENWYKYLAVSSPSLELFEDLTLEETIKFHFQLKPILANIESSTLFSLFQLEGNQKKQVRLFSSGMKQRLKLGLALLSDTPLLLLDEPTTNLDENGINWYKKMIEQFAQNRLVVVASNKIKDEYSFCTREIQIENYK